MCNLRFAVLKGKEKTRKKNRLRVYSSVRIIICIFMYTSVVVYKVRNNWNFGVGGVRGNSSTTTTENPRRCGMPSAGREMAICCSGLGFLHIIIFRITRRKKKKKDKKPDPATRPIHHSGIPINLSNAAGQDYNNIM